MVFEVYLNNLLWFFLIGLFGFLLLICKFFNEFFISDCAAQHVRAVPDQDRTHAPALEVQSLNRWTTRDVPNLLFF